MKTFLNRWVLLSLLFVLPLKSLATDPPQLVPIKSWAHSVSTLASLPSTGSALGDARVTRDSATLYIWNGSAWAPQGGGGSGGPFVPLAGGVSMTGQFNLSADPTTALQPTTKQYVDVIASGLRPHIAVVCATTANITLSGEQTIDGTLTSASRVLVKNQTDQTQNGIYVSAAGAWARASDMFSGSQADGAEVPVIPGGTNGNKGFIQVTLSSTIGVSNLVFGVFNSNLYAADETTLHLSGSNVFSIKDSGITNVKINAAAAIARSKIATGAASVVVTNDPTGALVDSSISTDDLSTLSGMFAEYGPINLVFDDIYSQLGIAAQWGSISGDITLQTDLWPFVINKELLANKSTNVALGGSNTLYPSQLAVKTYVDNRFTALGTGPFVPTGRRVLGTSTEIDVTNGGQLNADIVMSLSAVNGLTFGAAVMGCSVDTFGRATNCTDASSAFFGDAPILYNNSSRHYSLDVSGVTAGSYQGANITVDSHGLISSATGSTATSPINYSGGVISCDVASAIRPGCLPSADWTTFNGKQNLITGAASTVTTSNLSNNVVVVTNGSGKIASGTMNASFLDATSSIQTQLNALGNGSLIYGDGADGALNCTGAVIPTKDEMYSSAVFGAGCVFKPSAYRIFVNGDCDFTAAPAGAIQFNGSNGTNGGLAGGAGGVTSGATQTIGGSIAGGAGSTGTTTTGVAGVPGTVGSQGGNSGNSNAGGAGSSGAGGAGRGGLLQTNVLNMHRIMIDMLRGATVALSGSSAPGGGSGGGDGAAVGRGGGGGGSSGGNLALYCKTLTRGAGTAVGAIQTKGGNGGTSTAGGTNTGGGGGGGGGGPGQIYIVYGSLLGATGTNMLESSGGDAGAGGNGTGTGIGGGGGNGGGTGHVVTCNATTNVCTESFGSGGTNGSAGSGVTGGAGGIGNVFRVSL